MGHYLTDAESKAQSAELTRLRAREDVLVEALTQIEKGEGEFSRDPLEHCSNTVESMKNTARKALATLNVNEEL